MEHKSFILSVVSERIETPDLDGMSWEWDY